MSQIRKGDIISSEIFLGGGNEIASIEIPIFIDNRKFEIESIEPLNGFKPDYHYNTENSRLTILYLYDGISTLGLNNENIFNIRLRAKDNVDQISKYFHWDNSREIQLLNKDIEHTDAYV
jgi:hypothetical protein